MAHIPAETGVRSHLVVTVLISARNDGVDNHHHLLINTRESKNYPVSNDSPRRRNSVAVPFYSRERKKEKEEHVRYNIGVKPTTEPSLVVFQRVMYDARASESLD